VAKLVNYTKTGTEFLNDICIDPIDVGCPLFIATTLCWTSSGDLTRSIPRSLSSKISFTGEAHEFPPATWHLIPDHLSNVVYRRSRRPALTGGDMLNLSELIDSIREPQPVEIVEESTDGQGEDDDSTDSMDELYCNASGADRLQHEFKSR